MTTKTKERGLIVSDWEADAIREGRKTQARRVIPARQRDKCIMAPEYILDILQTVELELGKPGDLLWLRQAFSATFRRDESNNGCVYRADYHPEFGQLGLDRTLYTEKGRWTPSSQMPQWAARTIVELVSVRVERLRDMTLSDATAEGAGHPVGTSLRYGSVTDRWNWNEYKKLWNKANAKKGDPWESNPWVWVPEFKVIEGAA